MKAITLHQPFASLIAHGHKHFETRAWTPSRGMMGRRIAIHAAKKKPYTSFDELRGQEIPLGAIVCTATLAWTARITRIGFVPNVRDGEPHCFLADFVHAESARPIVKEYATVGIPVDPFGDYSRGRWIWSLTDVRRFRTPLRCQGRQGFWDVPIPICMDIRLIEEGTIR